MVVGDAGLVRSLPDPSMTRPIALRGVLGLDAPDAEDGTDKGLTLTLTWGEAGASGPLARWEELVLPQADKPTTAATRTAGARRWCVATRPVSAATPPRPAERAGLSP